MRTIISITTRQVGQYMVRWEYDADRRVQAERLDSNLYAPNARTDMGTRTVLACGFVVMQLRTTCDVIEVLVPDALQ